MRQKFLTTYWQRYPSLPKNWSYGRVLDKNMVCLPNKKKLRLNFSDYTLQSKDPEKTWNTKDILIYGDIIAWNTKTKSLVLLAPCLINYVEIASTHLALSWSDFISKVRTFFRKRKFQEVLTPTLVQSSGAETHLEPFATKNFFLPTSPEFHLKNLLAKGLNKVFEIRSCFRDEPATIHHQPEFTMLEWYRGYSDIESIITDTCDLLKEVAKQKKVDVVSMTDIWQKLISKKFDLDFTLTPQTTRKDLISLCEKLHIPIHNSDTWTDLFFRIFLEKIEPNIGILKPLIIRDFPPTMAALSRINNSGWADRFELYWRGLELANAYDELNDPEENLSRLHLWNNEKIALERKPIPESTELMDSLRLGIPPSGGIALGLDRLFMAIHKTTDIKKIRLFPYN